jgi:hypothetical protein
MRVDDEQNGHDIDAMLRHLDHAVPPVTAEGLIARAGASEGRGRLRWAAGIVLALGVAGAAWAIPGSPLRDWVAALTASTSHEPSPIEQAPPVDPKPVLAGIAVDPGARLVIEFLEKQHEGEIRITLTSGEQVEVRAPNGAARYTSEPGRLLVDNRGSRAAFEVNIPRTAAMVEVMVENSRTFLKREMHITPSLPANNQPLIIPF